MFNQFQWENNFLTLARKALEHDHSKDQPVQANHLQLQAAYQHCKAVTKANSKTFFMASNLLPPA